MAFLAAEAAPELAGMAGESGGLGALLQGGPGGPGLGEVTKHAPLILMLPLVFFAILFIIIAIIVVSAKKYVAGTMLGVLGLLLGGGAFFVMARSESKKER